MVSAHNNHVGYVSDDPGLYSRTQGSFLRDTMGENYLPIGFTFFRGSFLSGLLPRRPQDPGRRAGLAERRPAHARHRHPVPREATGPGDRQVLRRPHPPPRDPGGGQAGALTPRPRRRGRLRGIRSGTADTPPPGPRDRPGRPSSSAGIRSRPRRCAVQASSSR
ncbi:erythromycin esterase family protein [Streptomyces sp. Go40/10]|uniref:erythromycin esterase family protein n=1 Tax=Streptomyces sp. Go40/10 TaxID=2825844 RepID=UPI001E2DD4EB|nr:erythromycin esterase family protein [Streptomyces sp. Go40/10]